MIELNEGSQETKDILEALKEEAMNQTMESLPAFINKLVSKYEHDYGTIIKAMRIGMKATFHVMNNSDQGGITGFQAGAIAWEW